MTDETKKADHCMHVAALWWTQAAFWELLKRYGVGTQPHKQAGHMTAPDQCCTV